MRYESVKEIRHAEQTAFSDVVVIYPSAVIEVLGFEHL